MHLQFPERNEPVRPVGAAVARASGNEIVLEIGPADGLPTVRLSLTPTEISRVTAALNAVAHEGESEVVILLT